MPQPNKKITERILPWIVILAGFGLFLYWFLHNPTDDFTKSIPGMDNRPPKSHSSNEKIIIGEFFTEYDHNFTSKLTGKWPNFRGADYDNINKEEIPLIDKWPKDGPHILWKKDLGEGHAAAAIYNGRVYVLDYEERKERDVLRCYALENGAELWRRGYSVDIKRNHGMSRTIPAVNDKYVVTMGPKCQVMCCDAISGELKWGIDLVKDYRSEEPLWYTGQCPIIDDNVAVIGVGGSALVMGVDCETGEIKWQTPNPDSVKMSHASVVPMKIAGKKMYIYNALGGLCGISAEKDDIGKLLWVSKDFTPAVIAPSPIYVGNNRIFATAGYGAGAALIQIDRNGNNYTTRALQKYKPSKGMASEQQTPIYKDGLVFNVQTKDAGKTRNQFVCCKADDFKNIIWTSSTTERFGLGPYMIADNKFFVMNDEGELTIARYSTSKFEVLDKAQVIEGDDTWGPFALADGRLILRDSKTMVCVDLRANQNN